MDLEKWWGETTRPLGAGLQSSVNALGNHAKNIGDGLGSGIMVGLNGVHGKLGEIGKVVTGQQPLNVASDQLDLGFITVRTGPKPSRTPGGYHFATSEAHQILVEYAEDDEDAAASAAGHSKASSEEEHDKARQLGFIKLVPKKEFHHCPRSHFGTRMQTTHKSTPAMHHGNHRNAGK